MKKTFRIISLLLAAALSVGLMAGCTPSVQDPSVSGNVTDAPEEETPVTEEAYVFSESDGDGTDERIYVALSGSDTEGDGSKIKPYASLDRARAAARELSGDIRVIFGEGTYYIGETVEFTREDSADEGARITYRADKGAKVIFSGGVKVEGWTLHDGDKNIYKATVESGHCFRQLYVNGELKTMARNTAQGIGEDAYSNIAYVTPFIIGQGDAADGAVYINETDLPEGMTLDELVGAELHEVISWTSDVFRIKSAEYVPDHEFGAVDLDGGFSSSGDKDEIDEIKIIFEDRERELIFNKPHPYIGKYYNGNWGYYPYYLSNAYGLIDLPGEWYLDRDTDTLYYMAEQGVDPNTLDFIAPKTETLIRVEGEKDSLVKGISFENIEFAYTNWTYPSEQGLVGGQGGHPVHKANLANQIYVQRPSAAIEISYAEGFRLEGSTIYSIGNMTALDLIEGTRGSVIKNNTVTRVAGNGIMVAKFTQDENTEFHVPYNPNDERELCVGDSIINNTVTYTGLEYEGTVAISGGYPRELTIAHNEVGYTPYTAISVGYGWTGEETAMSGNVIYRNDIHNYQMRTNDGAGIYTLSRQDGSLIAENYLHDIAPDSVKLITRGDSIYTDEATMGYVMVDNVSVNGGGYKDNRRLGGDKAKQLVNQNNIWDGRSYDSLPDWAKSVVDNAGPAEYLNDTDEVKIYTNALMSVTSEGDEALFNGFFGADIADIKAIFTTEGRVGAVSSKVVDSQFDGGLDGWSVYNNEGSAKAENGALLLTQRDDSHGVICVKAYLEAGRTYEYTVEAKPQTDAEDGKHTFECYVMRSAANGGVDWAGNIGQTNAEISNGGSETVKVTVTPDSNGEYYFFCDYNKERNSTPMTMAVESAVVKNPNVTDSEGVEVQAQEITVTDFVSAEQSRLVCKIPAGSVRVRLSINGEETKNYAVSSPQSASVASYTYYEGEKGELSGAAVVNNSGDCSGGQCAGYLGYGADNAVTLTVNVGESGNYDMAVYYCSMEDRAFDIFVNGVKHRLEGLNSGSYESPDMLTLTVALEAGDNEIVFTCEDYYAPNLDRIGVANSAK